MITLQKIKNIGRFREIVTVLIRHGFGEAFDRLNLPATIYLRSKVQEAYEGARLEPREGRRLRMALEQLGATFVKLGQILSTRADLFSEETLAELSQLQAGVPPFPFEEVRTTFEEDGKRPLGEVFREFDPVPLAAASIGQVHRATLLDGTRVAVKVRRPGVEEKIQSDLDILDYIAHMLEERMPETRVYSPVETMREVRRTLTWELDYINEAQNMREFARNFQGDPDVFVPRVFLDASSSRVLVMDFVEGTPHARILADGEGVDRAALAKKGVRAILSQLFMHGFFHADPHPGNIRVLSDGRLCFLDFGMMGRLDRSMIARVTDVLMAVATGDYDAAARSLVRLGDPQKDLDYAALRREVREIAHRYYGVSLEKGSLSPLVAAIFRLAAEHKVRVPGSYALMVKAFVTMDDVGKRLDPTLNMATEARPFVMAVLRNWHPNTRSTARGGARCASSPTS
ncbi:MAG: AarF/UbiB family protein [Acidobacteriota bacterium]